MTVVEYHIKEICSEIDTVYKKCKGFTYLIYINIMKWIHVQYDNSSYFYCMKTSCYSYPRLEYYQIGLNNLPIGVFLE